MTDNIQENASSRWNLPTIKILDGMLLFITMLLMVAVFFSMMDILPKLGALIIVQTTLSYTQQQAMLTIVRDVWAICGGFLMLVYLIISLEYHGKHLGDDKTRKLLFWTLFIEIIIVVLPIIF